MLEHYLSQSQKADVRWLNGGGGLRACRFSVAGPGMQAASVPVQTSPWEVFFCRGGRLLAEYAQNRLLTVERGEICLAARTASLRSLRIAGRLEGILVTADPKEAGEASPPWWAGMGGTADTERLRRRMEEQDGCVVLSGTPWTQALFEYLECLPEEEQKRYCMLKAVELGYLLCMGGCRPEKAFHPSGTARSMAEVRAYMERHLSEKLTIPELSRRFSLAPTSLKAEFRRACGMSVRRWLIEERMKRAKELLQTTDMPIQQVALSVGYEGVSQFYAAFGRHYGMTPGQLAKMSGTGNMRPPL